MSSFEQVCGAETRDGSECGRPTGGGKCWQHQNGHSHARYEPGEVAEAILEASGVLVDASDILGCDPATVHRYVRRYDSCEQARDDGRRVIVDEAQSTLRELLDSEDDRIRLDAAETVLRHFAETEAATGGQDVDGIRFVYDEDGDDQQAAG